jgi:hypothetical protein
MRRYLLPIVVLLALAGLAVWLYARLTHIEPVLTLQTIDTPSEPDINDSIRRSRSNLFERSLVFCTQANVPLRLRSGAPGIGLLDTLRIPERFRPGDIIIGREPVRDEWNIAYVHLLASSSRIYFLTSNNGSWMQTSFRSNGTWLFATKNIGGSQDIFAMMPGVIPIIDVAPSLSFDRMPSGADGIVVFHSFRDHTPGGDLYMTHYDPPGEEVTFDVTRLTDNPNVEYTWPKISSGGKALIAVERPIGQQTGRVILWEIRNKALINPIYLTENGDYRFPSLDSTGKLACWQARGEFGKWIIDTWTPDHGIESLYGWWGGSLSPDFPDLTMPSLSPDGHFIALVCDRPEPGADTIGVIDMVEPISYEFSGCNGSFMFPSLSDPIPVVPVQ